MPESTPAAPEPIDDGLSEAPDVPDGEASGVGQAPSGAPDRPSHAPGSPSPDGPQRPGTPPAPTAPGPSAPAGGSRKGGCMTAMLGLFVVLAALLGIASQL